MPLALDMSVTLSTSFVFSGYWMGLTETVSMTTCALLRTMCEVESFCPYQLLHGAVHKGRK